MTTKVEAGYFDWREAINAEGEYTSAEVPYFVFEAASEADALTAVKAKAPEKIGRLHLDEIAISERINEDTYKAEARYVVDEQKDRADGDNAEEGNAAPQVSFDTTGGTRHMNQSLETRSKMPANAPDYGRAIEVDGEGNVNGVDVTMPTMTFSETHSFAPSKVTVAYQKKLFALTGTINKSSFRGFAAGEVLFLGASGQRSGMFWDITFKFAVSPNQASVKVSDEITVTNKRGWDYLWVRFGEKVEAGVLRKVPVAAYVERVYEDGDFSDLKLVKPEKPAT